MLSIGRPADACCAEAELKSSCEIGSCCTTDNGGNYLKHTEINQLVAAKKACDNGDQQACSQRDVLNALDKQRQQDLLNACSNAASSGCSIKVAEASADFDGLALYQQQLWNKVKAGEITYQQAQPYLTKAAEESKDIATHLKDYFYQQANGDTTSVAWLAAKQLEALNVNDLSNLWGATAAIGAAKKSAGFVEIGPSLQVKPLTSKERIDVAALNDSPLYTVTKVQRGEEANAAWPKDPSGTWAPPYKADQVVTDVISAQPMSFVRFYSEGENKPQGSWLVPANEVRGLTPAQIQEKLGLAKPPTHMVDVNLPPGVPLKLSIAGEQPAFGKDGGGMQVQINLPTSQLPVAWFGNSRAIP